MLEKCTYNSQYIAHYAQVEPIKMLTETDMRHNETHSHYSRVRPFQFYHVLGVMTKVNLLILNSYLQLCALKFSKLCQLMPMMLANAYTHLSCSK